MVRPSLLTLSPPHLLILSSSHLLILSPFQAGAQISHQTFIIMHEYGFEKLDAWKELRILVRMIYIVTEKFPSKELFGLVNQLRRAGVSSASNIAEGNSRLTAKDKNHFYVVSYSSLMEILAQIIISYDLSYINDEDLGLLREQLEKCSRLVNGLQKSTERVMGC
jgi:four helix bundle protein